MTGRKNKPSQQRTKLPFYVGGGILALLLVAFITTGLSGSNDGESGGSTGQEYADVSISGSSLPPYSQETADPAVGMAMPEITGENFDAAPITITNDGRPKVILFLAHW